MASKYNMKTTFQTAFCIKTSERRALKQKELHDKKDVLLRI